MSWVRRLLELVIAVAVAAAVVSPSAGAVTTTARPAPNSSPGPASQDVTGERLDRTTPTPAPALVPSVDPFAPGGSGEAPAAGGSDLTPGTGVLDDAGVESSSGNFMKRNGLRSPMCPKGDERPSCKRSGTIASPAPPGHYVFDVHIDKDVTDPFVGVWSGLLKMLWSGIVLVTSALFAALEWAMSLDLILKADAQLGPRLGLIWNSWTYPLSVAALMVGALWMARTAIGKRDFSGAVSRLLSGFALWAVVMTLATNPTGTLSWITGKVGELGRGAVTIGLIDPTGAGGNQQELALNNGLTSMFSAVVVAPWAMLEFGDVEWATSPDKLDDGLKQAATKIASHQSKTKQQLVSDAQTNADLFLIWPEGSNERNSISDNKCDGEACLLRVLCDNDDDNDCKGPNAARAEQRTESGAVDRTGQLTLVTLGLVPIWALIGILALGWLSSSVLVVYHLLEATFYAFMALTGFKKGWEKAATPLIDMAQMIVAVVVYAIATGLAMSVFMLIMALDDLGWLMQWGLASLLMFMLWKRRDRFGHSLTARIGAAGLLANPRAMARRTRKETREKVLKRSHETRRRRTAPAGGAWPDAAQRRPGLPRDRFGRTAGERLEQLPKVGPAFAAAGEGVRRAQRAGRAAAAIAPTGRGSKAAMLGTTLMAGSGAGFVAGAAITGWKARSLRNARRLQGINSGKSLPQRLSPLEQTHALLAGAAATRRAAGQQAARKLPGLRLRRDQLTRERSAVLEELGASPNAARRRQLEKRRESLNRRLSDVSRQVNGYERAELIGQRAGAHQNADGTFSRAAREKASTFLDSQAALPREDRHYARLAQIRHLTPQEFAALPDAERLDLQRDIDSQLERRTTPESRPAPERPAEPPTPAPASSTATVQRLALSQHRRSRSSHARRPPAAR